MLKIDYKTNLTIKLKAAMYIFTILFSGIIVYLGFNRLKATPTFLFEKTEETIGTVTEIKWIYGKKGSYIQSLTYEYQVVGSRYSDKFTIGPKQAKRKIGDSLILKYSVKKPQKNEIIGYNGNASLSDTRTTDRTDKSQEKRYF